MPCGNPVMLITSSGAGPKPQQHLQLLQSLLAVPLTPLFISFITTEGKRGPPSDR